MQGNGIHNTLENKTEHKCEYALQSKAAGQAYFTHKFYNTEKYYIILEIMIP